MQFVTHKATSFLNMMLEKIVFLSKGKKKEQLKVMFWSVHFR